MISFSTQMRNTHQLFFFSKLLSKVQGKLELWAKSPNRRLLSRGVLAKTGLRGSALEGLRGFSSESYQRENSHYHPGPFLHHPSDGDRFVITTSTSTGRTNDGRSASALESEWLGWSCFSSSTIDALDSYINWLPLLKSLCDYSYTLTLWALNLFWSIWQRAKLSNEFNCTNAN